MEDDGAALRPTVLVPLQRPASGEIPRASRLFSQARAAALRQERCGIQPNAVDEEDRSAAERPAAAPTAICPNHVRSVLTGREAPVRIPRERRVLGSRPPQSIYGCSHASSWFHLAK